MPRFLAALLSLAKNAVPAFGVFARDWAPPGALLLYLGENIVLVLLGALLVRMLAPSEEVIDGRPKSKRESLQTFFLIAAPFTFGAAVLTSAVILIRSDDYTLRPRELLTGFAMMLVFQLLAFATNVRRLRGITLAESENMLVAVLGRVFLLAFAVWAGLLLALFVTTAFVIPFMVLKTIVDLGSIRPGTVKRRLMGV